MSMTSTTMAGSAATGTIWTIVGVSGSGCGCTISLDTKAAASDFDERADDDAGGAFGLP